MLNTDNSTFDLTSFRKIWKSDRLESEVTEIQQLLTENPLLVQTLSLRNASLAIIDLKRMEYTCSFGDVEQVCGWSKQSLLDKGVGFFVSKLIPHDYSGLLLMSEIMGRYVAGLSEERCKNFKGLFDFQMAHPDGTVRRIMQEGLPLKRDPDGNILFLLALITDISNLKRGGKQHLRLTDGEENLIYEINESGACRQLESLSSRELEIAKLTGQKYTSERIAQMLFLSPNTINTHRQNMLRKFDLVDTMELINFLTVYQMI